jgi:nitrile hydratase
MPNYLPALTRIVGIVPALNERPSFLPGDSVRVTTRSPIGHYRVPGYLRGRSGTVLSIIEPPMVDNETEGYGQNAGSRRYYYRVSFPLRSLWAAYDGAPADELRIEIFETWLERI